MTPYPAGNGEGVDRDSCEKDETNGGVRRSASSDHGSSRNDEAERNRHRRDETELDQHEPPTVQVKISRQDAHSEAFVSSSQGPHIVP